MPLFILFGGEIVLLLFALRIALWVWRGRRARLRTPPPPGPPRGGLRALSGYGGAADRDAAPGEPAPLPHREAA